MLWTRATRKRPCAYLRAPVMHMTWPLNCSSKHITDAMVITNLDKEDMVGEHARCLYKLSQALYQDESREKPRPKHCSTKPRPCTFLAPTTLAGRRRRRNTMLWSICGGVDKND